MPHASRHRLPPTGGPAPTGLVEIDRNGLEVLGPEECARLLASTTFGRIAISQGALPVILPLNYRCVDGRIVFRTGIGSKLDAAACGSVVAFEIDSIDAMAHTGWSVVVTGVAAEVSDPAEVAHLEAAQIPHWAPSGNAHLVELPLQKVSGRRLIPGARPPEDGRGREQGA